MKGKMDLEVCQELISESMGKSQGAPLLAAGGNHPAYDCVNLQLAFSLESPLDESEGQARETK